MTVTEYFSSKMECDIELSLIFCPGPEWLPECGWAQRLLAGMRGLWCVDREADDSITFKKPCLNIGHGSFKHVALGVTTQLCILP